MLRTLNSSRKSTRLFLRAEFVRNVHESGGDIFLRWSFEVRKRISKQTLKKMFVNEAHCLYACTLHNDINVESNLITYKKYKLWTKSTVCSCFAWGGERVNLWLWKDSPRLAVMCEVTLLWTLASSKHESKCRALARKETLNSLQRWKEAEQEERSRPPTRRAISQPATG